MTEAELRAERDAAYECIRRMYDSNGASPSAGASGAWVDAFDVAMKDYADR